MIRPSLSSFLLLGCVMTMTSTSTFSDNTHTIVNYPEKLQQKIASALHKKGQNYEARTRHYRDGQPIYTNRLIFADSPYLLQHAHNPVNWYPWEGRGFCNGKIGKKAHFSLYWLCDLPLVPCDGRGKF